MIQVDVHLQRPRFGLDVSFQGDSGITALFGRSGSGKTTVIDIIAGLVRPDSGLVRIGNRVLFDDAAGIDLAPERRGLGYVFQEDRLFPHMSVKGNLTYGRRIQRKTADGIGFDQVVGLLDIAHLLDQRPHQLSGGEKQRVAIGRALLANPQLLLMDEPLANLDAGRRGEILPFIETLRDELALPIFYVSHSANEIVRLADTMVLLSDGQSIASGPVEEVMSRLDLSPLTGRYDAGSVLPATVGACDAEYGLTRLETPAGPLWAPVADLVPGSIIRVRIRARDVSLALSRPKDASLTNHFTGRIVELAVEAGPLVDVLLDVGCALRARITRRSVDRLGLAVGAEVHALVKTVAIDRASLGRRGSEVRR